MTILLTGSSGFIGQRYVEYNAKRYDIKTVSLRTSQVEDIDFLNIDTIVHLAGMAHQMQKIDSKIYFDVNFELTKKLALAAKKAGVSHFIFMSTIKVFGEFQDGILTEQSPCLPVNDPYGESKLQAEQYLQSIKDKNFTVSIIRPPLVYGPKVKGNLIRFLRLGNQPFPLPFANINNRRTMVFLDNLIELTNTITEKKISGIFLAGDRQPLSTTQLISEIRKGLGKKTNLFSFPALFKFLLHKIKPALYIRLFGSLEMDTSTTNATFSFIPPYSVEEGISAMVNWYLNSREV